MDISIAADLHQVIEPCHSFVYFAPETQDAYAAAGLKGQWMGYFASRAAAMGAVTRPVVQATFYNFAPALVDRALPEAWTLSTPERVLDARYSVVDQALRRMLGDMIDSDELREAAELARTAALAADCAGRPLAAAHQGLEWLDTPHMVLWQAGTVLREHRGDGHIAALLRAGLNGREALLSVVAIKPSYRDFVTNLRGYTPEELAEAQASLEARGLVDADGNGTAACVELRQSIEDDTNRMAMQPYRAIGQDKTERLVDAFAPIAAAIKGA